MKKIQRFLLILFWISLLFVTAGLDNADTYAAIRGDGTALPDLRRAEWLILGPFPNLPSADSRAECQGFQHDYLTSRGGEAKARFHKGQKIAGYKIAAVTALQGAVDLLGPYPNSVNAAAYAYLEVTAARPYRAALKLGSDDGVKVWCNGRLIWSNHAHRALTPDEDAIAVPFKAGKNRLLLKIDQGDGGWGFTARFRSLREEAADWAHLQSPAYQIILPNPVLAPGQTGRCTVTTVPSLAVPEPVRLLIRDVRGKVLCSVSGAVGKAIPFRLPGDAAGIVSFQAVGAGKNAAVESEASAAICGDVAAATREAVALARAMSGQVPFNAGSEDAGATLTYLADQLEGKVHPSLTTLERNIRAIGGIQQIAQLLRQGPWQTAALRGTRQWAYRSAIDDSPQPYTVYLPQGYDPHKQYRLIIALHGYSGDDYQAVKKLGDLKPDDFIIAGAFGRGDMGYRSLGEQDVLDLLGRLQEIYRIDPDCVYLMGESMGGMGAWRIGQFYAERFAALAPFCGWTGTEYLENLRNLPVLIVHGDSDGTVPIAMDRAAARSLQGLGYDCRFDVLPGGDHNAWSAWAQSGGGNRIFDYFRQHRRNPWPAEINLAANYLRYGRQFWVALQQLAQPLARGAIHALVAAPREVRIETKGVTAFTVDLRHPKLKQSGTVTVRLDNCRLTVPAGAQQVLFERREPDWTATASDGVPSDAVAPHLGGGGADLFHGPVTIVYGTKRPDRTAGLKAAAAEFAAWTPTPQIPIGSKVGQFPVKADTEVSEGEIRNRNLLLIGNAAENKVTAAMLERLAGRVPVTLDGDDVTVANRVYQKTGLVLTYPNPFSPRQLMAIVTLPGETLRREMRYANLPFRGYNVNETATLCHLLPDVAVFQSFSQPATAWCFDRSWERLIPWTNQ